jgi:hypothetical protein
MSEFDDPKRYQPPKMDSLEGRYDGGILNPRILMLYGAVVALMKTLLSRFIGNIEKDPLYDEIIAEFAALGEKRNNYVHSKWWTHESGRVFMQQQLMDTFAFGTKEGVKCVNRVDFAMFSGVTEAANGLIATLATR